MNNNFTIILPVKNGGEYIKECVKSILNQTYTHFELIVLIHDTTDDTMLWLQSINNNRLKINYEKNVNGIVGNWSRILEIPKNEFMTIIGYDDILLSNYLETMNNLINEYPDASLYQTHFEYINAEGNFVRNCKKMSVIEDGSQFLKSYLQYKIDIMGTGFMLRTIDYQKIGGIDCSYPNLLFADLKLWIDATIITYKVTSTNICFQYRLHQSTTKKTSNLKLLNAYEKIIYYFYNLQSIDFRLKSSIQQNIFNFIHHHCASFSHRILKSENENISIKEFINKNKNYTKLFSPSKKYFPYKNLKLFIARIIDSNYLFKKIFLQIRKRFF